MLFMLTDLISFMRASLIPRGNARDLPVMAMTKAKQISHHGLMSRQASGKASSIKYGGISWDEVLIAVDNRACLAEAHPRRGKPKFIGHRSHGVSKGWLSHALRLKLPKLLPAHTV